MLADRVGGKALVHFLVQVCLDPQGGHLGQRKTAQGRDHMAPGDIPVTVKRALGPVPGDHFIQPVSDPLPQRAGGGGLRGCFRWMFQRCQRSGPGMVGTGTAPAVLIERYVVQLPVAVFAIFVNAGQAYIVNNMMMKRYSSKPAAPSAK